MQLLRGTRHLYVQLLREVEGAFRNGVGFVYTGTKAFVCKCTFLRLALWGFFVVVCFGVFYEQLQTNDFLISVPLLESGLEM